MSAIEKIRPSTPGHTYPESEEKIQTSLEKSVSRFAMGALRTEGITTASLSLRVWLKTHKVTYPRENLLIEQGHKSLYGLKLYPFVFQDVITTSYALPGKDTAREIRSFIGNKQLVEVGAGSGWWGRFLQNEGFVWKGYEYAPEKKIWYQGKDFAKIEIITEEAVATSFSYLKNHGCDALFLCWPLQKIFSSILEAYEEAGGTHIVLIPCMMEYPLFSSILERNWKKVSEGSLPTVLNDFNAPCEPADSKVFFYIRKPELRPITSSFFNDPLGTKPAAPPEKPSSCGCIIL